MPGPTTSELFRPSSWDEFEDITRDLFAHRWRDPHAQRHGRSGQPQHGVDIYGQPAYLEGSYAGVQCKRYEDGTLTCKMIREEIAKAEGFTPALADYTIATTERRDAELQAAVRAIDAERRAAGRFPVHLLFWEDLCDELAAPANHDLLRKHYAGWLQVLAGALSSAHLDAILAHTADILREARADFVGRQWLFDAVAAFVDGHDRGYLVITAEAGLGKTALAAQLAGRYGGVPFFFHAPTGLTGADLCRRALCAQLITRFQLAHADAPAETGETGAFLARLLQEAAARQAAAPLVLVIDGIDEAEPPAPGQNLLLLPDRLPAGVYVLLIGRPGEYTLARAPGTPLEELTIRPDDPRQQADVMTFIRAEAQRGALAGAVAAPLSAIDDIVDRIATASEGNFMYLRYVLADRVGSGVDAAVVESESLPRGLAGYYDRFWAQLARLRQDESGWERWDRLQRPTLALLAVAGEPVDLAWLAAHTGRQPDELRERVLLPWRRFLRQDDAAGAERWHIVHQSFADYLAARRELNLPAMHRAVADYYRTDPARWAEHDGYAYRHLSRHLRRGGDHAALFALVDDPAWYRAQRRADPGGATALADVTQAWGAAEDVDGAAVSEGRTPPLLAREVRGALAAASLRAATAHLPPALLVALVRAGRWSLDHALGAARNQPDAEDRALALAALVAECPEGRQEAVGHEALGVARVVGAPERRATALTAVAASLPPGLAREALAAAAEVAPLVDDAARRVLALAAVAAVLPEPERAPLVTGALAALDTIAVDDAWREALLALAPLLSAGQRWRLLGRARRFADPRRRADALAALAPTLPARRRKVVLRAALDAALRLTDVHDRARPLTTLAPYLSREQLRAALEAAPPTPDAHWRLWPVLAALLGREAELGDPAGAVETAQAFRDPRLREHVLPKLAATLAALGQMSLAVIAARAIPARAVMAEVLARLLPNLTGAARVDVTREALDLAWQIGWPTARTSILEALAPHLPPHSLGEALMLTETLDDSHRWVPALLALLPELSDEERHTALRFALVLARRIGHEASRARALAALAPVLPPDLQAEVLMAAAAIVDLGARAEVLVRLAPIMPEATRLLAAWCHQVLAEVATLPEEWDRAAALRFLVREAPIPLLDDVLAAAGALESKLERDGLLSAVARRRAEAGDPAGALAAARRIASASHRTEVLARLVPLLPVEERAAVVDEVLAGLRSGDDEVMWGRASATLLPALDAAHLNLVVCATRQLRDPAARAGLLIRLLPRVSPSRRRPLRREILAVLWECGAWERDDLLVALAPRLPRALIPAAFALLNTLSNAYARSRVVTALAPRLQGLWLTGAWEWAIALPGGEPGRVEALAALAVRFPAADRPPAIAEALGAIGANGVASWSADALATLAPHLCEEQPQAMLRRVLAAPDEPSRSRLLAALVPSLMRLPGAARYDAWRILLHGLADRGRADFLAVPGPIWALLVSQGSPAAAAVAADALLEIVARWP